MKKKYLVLVSLVILLSISLVYAQQQYNTWIGWPLIRGIVAPANAQITAHSQEDNSIVSNNVRYPMGIGIFMIPVGTGENDSVYFKINGMIVDQEPQKMNVDNGNDCSSFFVAGCDKNVHYLNLTVTDADNDNFAVGYESYTGADRDCNDNNPNINPNITETCNAIDDNCNEIIDDGFDKDHDGFFPANICTGYERYDTDDSDNLTYPGAGEVCDGKDNDNNNIVDNFTQSCYTGPEGTKGISFCHGGTMTCTNGAWGSCIGEVIPIADIPGDGIDQDCDGADDIPLIGNKSSVKLEGIDESIFNITVDGVDLDSVGALVGEMEFEFREGNKTLFRFKHNFSVSSLDINISYNVSDVEGKGAVIISRLDLQSGSKKYDVLVNKVVSAGKVCIKDTEDITSLSGLTTSSCTGTDEHLITCNGVKQGDYTCTDLGDIYEIDGLTHSGVVENTYTAPASGGGGGAGGGGTKLSRGAATIEEPTVATPPSLTPGIAAPIEPTPEPTPAEPTTPEATPVEETTEEAPGFLAGITGAVIGAAGGTTGVVSIIVVVGIIVLFLFLNFYHGGIPGIHHHTTRAANLHRRAELAYKQGKHERATKLHKRAEALRERAE